MSRLDIAVASATTVTMPAAMSVVNRFAMGYPAGSWVGAGLGSAVEAAGTLSIAAGDWPGECRH